MVRNPYKWISKREEEKKKEKKKAGEKPQDSSQVLHVHRGSYMSARVLLNLFNELRKIDQIRGLPSILYLFRNGFDKFNNTGAQMLDSIYHRTIYLFIILLHK